MGCCDRDNDPERCCMCLPYADGFLIAAMVLSIVGVVFSVSSFFFPLIPLSIITMVLLQLFWCFRQPCAMPYIAFAAAVVCSIVQLGFGIFIVTAFRNQGGIDIFTFLSFISAAVWAVAAGFMAYFVFSGRYTKWEEARSKPKQPDETLVVAVELESGPDPI